MSISEDNDIFTQEEFIGLAHLARGNFKLIEDALIKHMKKRRKVWWKIWEPRYWSVDRNAVIEYITTNVKQVDQKVEDMIDETVS